MPRRKGPILNKGSPGDDADPDGSEPPVRTREEIKKDAEARVLHTHAVEADVHRIGNRNGDKEHR
jgi:hypothetical protein